MRPLEFTLPGGLVHRGAVLRRARLRPLTGRLELALTELGVDAIDRTDSIDHLLTLALDRVDELESSPELPRQMGVGDRDHALVQLVTLLHGARHWLSSRCRRCGELLDVEIDLAALPVSPAGRGYPTRTLEHAGHTIVVRVPVGADLAAVRSVVDEHEAARLLLTRCIASIDGIEVAVEQLGVLPRELLDVIDAALDELTPLIADRVATACPSCDTAHELSIDPLALLIGSGSEPLFEEIHALASSYHWSAQEILDLPREHRRRYLRLISRAQGMVSQGDA